MSSFKRAENNRINSLINSENKNNNKRDKKYINDILTNIVKNKEKKDGSVIKEERRSRYVNRSNRNENDSFKDDDDEIEAEEFEKRLKGRKRVRHCSQDIRTNLDLQQGNEYLEKFNKEFGTKPFADKRKVELWGAKMGKEGLLVLLNNKHKFLELEELVLARVKLNSIDFLENIFVDRLKILNLELNRISSLNVLQNLQLKNLEVLNFSNNGISSIDVNLLQLKFNILKFGKSTSSNESIEVI
jgi:Leucine-rich repeat (LRR) protein